MSYYIYAIICIIWFHSTSNKVIRD